MPFTQIYLDMTSPYLFKDMVKGYSHRKNWPMLFCCLNTGALHIELDPRQDTSAFLLCWEAFKAARGIPSDKGLQPDHFCQLHRGSYGHPGGGEDLEVYGQDWDQVEICS